MAVVAALAAAVVSWSAETVACQARRAAAAERDKVLRRKLCHYSLRACVGGNWTCHLLLVAMPCPRAFFGRIVALVTVAAMVSLFALEGSLEGKICAVSIQPGDRSVHR